MNKKDEIRTRNSVSESEKYYEVFQNLSTFLTLEYEPVGKWFEQYNTIRHQGDMEIEEESSSEEEEEEEEIEETPEYLKYLESLDPKNWKDQDHYKVLGLEKLRFKATQHQIKRAHKSKVLKHHPDKQKQSGTNPKERDFFACITKAFEQLSDPIKRKSFDSVDPSIDDNIPASNEKNKKNFYKIFGAAFDRNGRWSIKKKLPSLGDDTSTFDHVNDFYSFWYDFDSWREFSYLDEESKDTAQDRDERRWIDKENKATRAKKKKEEVKRIRQMVDNAYACDPRIAKFKQEQIKLKDEKKNQRKEAARLKAEEEQRKIDEANAARLKMEEEEKARIEANKKEKEKEKKAIKKERKNLRTLLKEWDYFATKPDEKLQLLEDIEALVDSMPLKEIQSLNENIQKCENDNEKKTTARHLIFSLMDKDKKRKVEEEEDLNAKMASAVITDATNKDRSKQNTAANKEWHDDEIKLLVKGSQLIPMGTRDRWDVIANFIEEHSRGKFKRTGKETLAKSKDIGKLGQPKDAQEQEEQNRKAYEKSVQNIKTEHVMNDPSKRSATPGEQLVAEVGSNPAVWSVDEQKILEQALKTYPSTTEDRWDKISDCLPARSKKDCMVRYKELVDMIRAKKLAADKAKRGQHH